MEQLNERVLNAWLGLSTTVINSRVVSELPYNESLVCNALYRELKQEQPQKLTATDLCNRTRILKSQMNRTLKQLEKKSVIIRQRCPIDKRKSYIMLNDDGISVYQKQHQVILSLIDGIIEQLGEDKVLEAITLFQQVSDIASNILDEN